MKTFKEMRKEGLQEKLGFNGSYRRKSRYDGKQFDKNKEIKQIAKIKKVLELIQWNYYKEKNKHNYRDNSIIGNIILYTVN